MSIIKSPFNIFRRESAPATPNEGNAAHIIQGGSFLANVVQVSGKNSALTVSAWYRASEVLANTMSQLVMSYQRKLKPEHGGCYVQYDRGTGAHLNYLLQVRPNPTMSAAQFWAGLTLARFFDGNGVAYVEHTADGEIRYLWLCASASLDITTNTYTITYNTHHGAVSRTGVSAYDIIHWRNTFSSDHGITGISTLRYAQQTLSTAATNNRQARDIAAKGGKHKILLSEREENSPIGVTNLLTKPQKRYQRDQLQEELNEGKDVLLVSGSMQAQIISQDAQSQQLLESRKFDITDVARYSGVPLVLLMDYSNNTYKAPEQAMQAFLQHTISPMAAALEQEINEKLIGESGWPTLRCHFITDNLMRLDPKGRAELGKLLMETGVKCVNELRADNDLPNVAGGDRHFISTNMQPLDAPAVGKQQEGGEE